MRALWRNIQYLHYDKTEKLLSKMQWSFGTISLACRGICERYRSESQRYGQGIQRCTSCETYLEYDWVQCPCCRTHLRAKRKTKRYRS